MSKVNSTPGIDELRQVLEVLRAFGATRYRCGDLEVELGPVMPPRALDDFATPGYVGVEEDDGRFDHVAMRPRREEEA